MADNTQQTVDSGGYAGGSLSAGTRIPYFKPGRGRPSIFKSEDMNKMVKVCNALLGLQIKRIQGPPVDGSTQSPYGRLVLTEDSAIIELYDGGISGSGGGGSIQMTVYSEQDDYVLCVDPNGVIQAVAKPWWLRRATYTALSPWTGPDAVHTFTWSAISKRTDATPDPSGTGTLTEDAIIYPPYVVGSTLLATQPSGGTGVVITDAWNSFLTTVPIYQEINDNQRDWVNNTIICYKNSYLAYLLTKSQPYITSI